MRPAPRSAALASAVSKGVRTGKFCCVPASADGTMIEVSEQVCRV
jgi:hypothetical protein